MSVRAVMSAPLQKGGTVHGRHIVVAVLAVAVTMTSAASAGPAAAKQRVAVTAEVFGKAVLDPLQQ